MYPEIAPFYTEMFAVSPLHSIYVERSGTHGGCPIFFIHGGPGSSTNANHRRYFDPTYFDIVLFDQRGCGRSKPLGEVTENTTWALVDDIRAIREALNITKKINLFAGSWGATLALAYTLTYPETVDEMILRGIFLGTSGEVDWYTKGLSRFAFSAWEDFSRDKLEDLLTSYYQAVNASDENIAFKAAQDWCQYEAQIMSLGSTEKSRNITEASHHRETLLARTRVQLHYLKHQCFLKENQLMNCAPSINSPVTIVQGEIDMVCPPQTAYQLSQQLPHAKLRMVSNAGHGGLSAPLADVLTEEANNLRDRMRMRDESSI